MAKQNINPITRLDYPDPDIIRVDDTYYMVSTTMYFMPGCEILRSYDLVHWEHAAYVYDRLDSTDAQRLEGKENIYGQGMWAASLRYHGGFFFVCFVCNDTHKTYVYTSPNITGPWEKNCLKGFYHDNSILFDDDGRIYIISGNREIHLRELFLKETEHGVTLTDDVSEAPGNMVSVTNPPDKTGIDKTIEDQIIITDTEDAPLGYEGAHFYKIDGRYYIFLIHIPLSTTKRTESCFVSENVTGPYYGADIMDDDRGYRQMGVAQGGIVESPSGNWYAILFQDSGAVGRIPVLMPVTWEESAATKARFPAFGSNGLIPETFPIEDLRPQHNYIPLVGSDDFTEFSGDSFGFKSCWQFNHEPDLALVKRNPEKGTVTITTDKLCDNLVQAKNVLNQRTLFPGCSCHVDIDAGNLSDGDYAGLCVLESSYCFIAVAKRDGKFYLVQGSRNITTGGFWGERHDTEGFEENACIEIEEPRLTLYVYICYDHESFPGSSAPYPATHITTDGTATHLTTDDPAMHLTTDDTALFAYSNSGSAPNTVDSVCSLEFKLDHFTGARFGLFVYSTKEAGGSASFSNFIY